MASWEGKSKGTVTGYRIFIYLIKHVGLRAAYGLLLFVSLYYLLFSWRSTQEVYRYLRLRHGFSRAKSVWNTYQNYYVFGQTLIDRIAITAGLRDRYTYEFDGIENIHELAREQSAGIMISAHVGNFEVASHFLDSFEKPIHLVTTDAEREAIKRFLDSVMAKPTIQFLVVKEDLSHVFEMHQVIADKGMICFTGDRFMPQSKTLTGRLLGKEAAFPAGPFLLSAKLSTPVLFVYVMREKNRHYHLYARKAQFKNRDAQSLLDAYTNSMEEILAKYPLQWFNYYDFWQTTKA
jgi:predicted LPLAT superfamily acyltransferase